MATAKKKVTIEPCKECGGPRRGRAAHKPTCSFYKESSGTGKASKGKGGGYDKASLSRLDVTALVGLRDTVEEVLSGKAPEIDAKIKELQELKASIGKA